MLLRKKNESDNNENSLKYSTHTLIRLKNTKEYEVIPERKKKNNMLTEFERKQ